MMLLAHKMRREMTPHGDGLPGREEPLVQLRYYLQSVSSAFASIVPSATNHSEKAIPAPKIHQLIVGESRLIPRLLG